MFNKDFYPTPEAVAHQMCFGLEIENKTVYEPHGGKADLIKVIKSYNPKKVITSEINPDLQKICSTEAQLIGNDFLQVKKEDVSHVHHIIMNPPFSKIWKHILHAWEIAPDGCIVTTLLNTDSLSNYTYNKLAFDQALRQYGTIEHLGDCFSTVERKTDVNISMVRLYKPVNDKDLEFDGFFDMEEEVQGQYDTGVMKFDIIRSYVNSYVEAVKMFDEVDAMANKINHLTSPFSRSRIEFGGFDMSGGGRTYNRITRDEFKIKLQKTAWHAIFSELDMKKYVTQETYEQLNKYIENNSNVPFTRKNVFKMVEVIVSTHTSRMDNTLVKIFDEVTGRYKDNRQAVEGWKTNNQYFIAETFIMPYSRMQTQTTSSGHSYPVWYGYGSTSHILDDFTKALCYLCGKNYVDYTEVNDTYRSVPIKEEDALNASIKGFHIEKQKVLSDITTYSYPQFGKWLDFGFFKVKIYKKGTMHVKFNDVKVCGLFNQRIAKLKGWRLPERTGTDMRRKGSGVEVY